jgi:hypothetical protein
MWLRRNQNRFWYQKKELEIGEGAGSASRYGGVGGEIG